MSAVPAFTPSLADAELEAAIDIEIELMFQGRSKTEVAAAFERAVQLAGQRRPEMQNHLQRTGTLT